MSRNELEYQIIQTDKEHQTRSRQSKQLYLPIRSKTILLCKCHHHPVVDFGLDVSQLKNLGLRN